MSLDYWKECISIPLDEMGIELTDEQITNIADSVEVGHENYDMAFGYDVASANWESDEARELKALKVEIEKKELWINSTKPCKRCTTTGIVKDVWGRDCRCDYCSGKGRV